LGFRVVKPTQPSLETRTSDSNTGPPARSRL
jgi:hypothetical protein